MNGVANALLTATLLALLYGVWRVLTTVDVVFDAWTAVVVLAGLVAAGLLALLFVRFPNKLNLSILAASLAVGFVGGTYILSMSGRDLIAIFDAKVARPVAGAAQAKLAVPNKSPAAAPPEHVSGRPRDARTELQVSDDLAAAGIVHQQMRTPPLLYPVMDTSQGLPFFPLSMGSHMATIACNEGEQREFPIWHTDRYGYNNDDTVYARKNLTMIVGGSFSLGSCVQQEENIAGVLRRNGYPAFSAGIGQFGPVAALATLKEYGEHIQPKVVVLQYFDPNDVAILPRRELRSRIILQYLNDGFSQNLIERQPEVDKFWRDAEPLIRAYEDGFLASKEDQAKWETKLDENLELVRSLLGRDLKSLRDDDDALRIYERVVGRAQKLVTSWGGRMVLLMTPNADTYFSGTVPRYKNAVNGIMRRLGIPVLDMDPVMRATGDPLQYYPRKGRGADHFNPEGYAVAARLIMATLDGDAQ